MSLKRRIRKVEEQLGRGEKPCAEVFLQRAFTSEEQVQAEAELREWKLGLRKRDRDEQDTDLRAIG